MRRAFAGVDLALLDPFIMMDQMGEVEYAPGEPKGTPVAPAPRLRDRHLHHRRRLRPPGQPRRRGHDHQRRHPVDDRRRRDPAHRASAGVAGPVRRSVPRRPAVGQPAQGAEVARPALPGPAQRRGRPRHHPRRRRSGPRDRRRGRRRVRARIDVHADDDAARDGGADSRAPAAVAPRLQRARLRAAGDGTVGAERRPIRIGSAGRLRRRRRDRRCRRRRTRSRAARRWTSSSSAVSRFASRSPGAGRS